MRRSVTLALVLLGASSLGGSPAKKGPQKLQPSDSVRTEILKKIKLSSVPYEIMKTESGIRFFMIPPGPCSCEMETRFECVGDVDTALKSQEPERAAREKIQCSPNAGCSFGITTIKVECQNRL